LDALSNHSWILDI
jgi:hypothetical protein